MTNLIATPTRFQPLIGGLSLLALVATLSSTGFAEKKADLSRLVVVGDSLSAGFQNGSLLDIQQPHGYASLVASQARTMLPLPLIAAPGIPNVLTLVSPGPPPIIVPSLVPKRSRARQYVPAADGPAVPGANVEDALTTRPTPASAPHGRCPACSIAWRRITQPGWEWAENRHHGSSLAGNNDALGVIFTGDPSILTPVALSRQ
jgi:hypothetical protein